MTVIAHSMASIGTIETELPSGKPFQWIYLGRDYSQAKKFKEYFKEKAAPAEFISLSAELEKAAVTLRPRFMKWMDDLNRHYGATLEWWFTSLSSRNIYVSDLFLYICYIHILDQSINNQCLPGLIIAENEGLVDEIIAWCGERGLAVRPVRGPLYRSPSRRYMKFLVRYIFLLLRLLSYGCIATWTCWWYGSRRAIRFAPILIDTYISQCDIDATGKLNEPLHQGLLDWLTQHNHEYALCPTLSGADNIWRLFKSLRSVSVPLVIEFDYLKLPDYLRIAGTPLKTSLWRNARFPRFGDRDISNLCRAELCGWPNAASMMTGMRKYLFARRIAAAGYKPQILIDWFENQVIDKALVKGLRTFVPDITVVGAHLFVFSSNILHLFPLASEHENQMLPHVSLVTGPVFARQLKTYAPDIQSDWAPAMRYNYLHTTALQRDWANHPAAILILLPCGISECLEVLAIAGPAMTHRPEHYSIRIHPSTDANQIHRELAAMGLTDKVSLSKTNFMTALQNCNAVISTGSGTALEAVILGVPVIMVAMELSLTFNPLDGIPQDSWRMCHTSAQVDAALNYYLSIDNIKKGEYIDFGNKIKGDYFTPMNEAGMNKFVARFGVTRFPENTSMGKEKGKVMS